jgi:hypothetical protein
MPRWVLPLAIVAGGLFVVQLWHTGSPSTGPTYAKGSSAGTSVDPTTLPGMRTGAAPWGPGTAGLRQRLVAIGLPAASGSALHIHAHLDLFVEGRRIALPANVGIDEQRGVLAPLHTHDDSGLVHVESPAVRDYTLGQFFDVWGVRLTSTCLGGYCTQGERALRVYVDGSPATGDVRNLLLFKHEEIAVTFGTPAQLPSPVPSSFGFKLFE